MTNLIEKSKTLAITAAVQFSADNFEKVAECLSDKRLKYEHLKSSFIREGWPIETVNEIWDMFKDVRNK